MYMVDGYNLLHALRKAIADFPSDFRAARTRMVALLSEMSKREGASITVYFDGTPGVGGAPELSHYSVRCIFTAGDADAALRKAVADSHTASRLIVVSTDREVAGPCRDHGARTRKSEDIAARLARLVERGQQRRSAEAQPTVHALGEMEAEMLREVGDIDELVDDALSEPMPPLPFDPDR